MSKLDIWALICSVGVAGAGYTFFNSFFSTSIIILRLKGCQILKLDVLKVGTFKFAVLIATSKPF